MPFLCGPKNSRFTYTGNKCPHLDLALRSNASSLGEAILEYEVHFDVKVTPLSEPFDGNPENAGKFFEFIDLDNNHLQFVDIHIIRGNFEICPRQERDFPLESNDIVEFGGLIC